jgi:hypothetical protein
MTEKPEPKVGQKWKRGKTVATVKAVLKDYGPGAVLLDRPIENISYWNTDELTYVADGDSQDD